ncbi:fumarylacetoacetase [Hymenobacter sp. RP-2-7]|uniref:fumarylacetoacetase n=1 Tax=Hymenobacter polaris TaxID=2682546 RepID=A0A7Y0AB48_9BACT|nr:fumarylacetoacetase [Hymenobacter polaris]NML64119.1 fumarylacetoacetase [Hymenobacter polaris]
MPIDPALRSWIDIKPADDFPLQNLPFGIISTPDTGPRVAVAIGGYALDLYACAQLGYFDALADDLPTLGAALPRVFRRRSLNALLKLGRPVWLAVRERCAELLRYDNPALRDSELGVRACLLRRSEVELLRPVKPTNYTDFYSSLEHATNAGSLFRPGNPLLPNWRHLPVAYHGRASSVVASGTPVRRPQGQYLPAGATAPTFGPTQMLDFELEMAFVVGQGTALGSTVPLGQAESYIFGLLLFNDWSARDIQSWEYQPLGPFLGKSFASSVSGWVVTLDALEPFRVPGPAQEPAPLPYLQASGAHHFDITLEVLLQPAEAPEPTLLCRTNTQHLYWSMAQQLTHHASNGCPLAVGDLCASGTISGAAPDALGCLLELTRRGQQPLTLPDGSSRAWLADGDTVIMRGYAAREGLRIGLGEVRGTVLPAAE